ncbi:TIGR00180 family glycosyltransferase [Halobacteriovorax sp. HLS]|uniref:TIGR00180 family glycosyltransferase n=1 Tax=Halobacteriovorax sp. HLS TaxID=2234000 RepID=UPI000FDBF43A|nr:TIGR00180 family glycosyltransferase [Halobacteriovorax sp. HLS]
MKVAIAVPTLDRPDFIIRMLHFYINSNSNHPIHIGDSSSQENFQKVSKFIEKTSFPFKVFHHDCGKLNDSEAILYCLDNIEEKYSTFSGDDDFHFPESLSACAEFLENNNDYATCHGKGVTFETGKEAKGKLLGISKYNMGQVEDENPLDRLTNFTSNYYVPLFSVHRNDEFKNSFRLTTPLPDRGLREVLPNILAIVSGKSKKLELTSVARNTHYQRFILPDYDTIMKQEAWRQSYDLLCGITADKISEHFPGKTSNMFLKPVELAVLQYIENAKKRSVQKKERTRLAKTLIAGVKLMFPKVWSLKLNSTDKSIYKKLTAVIEN